MSGSNPLTAALAQAGQQRDPFAVAKSATDLRTSQFNLQQAQLQPAYQAMRQIMATNPNPQWSDVQNSLAQAARIGANVDGLVANANETMNRGGNAGDFIRAYGLGGMSPEAQGALAGPQMQARQTAQGTYYGTVGGAWSPNANVFQPTGFMERGFTPGEASEFIAVPDVDANGRPTGTTHLVPRATVVGPGGGAPAVGGGGGGPAVGAGGAGSGTSASAAVNNFGNIRVPGGGFASYATPQDGVAAMASNLTAYQDQHGINTLNGITARWAPQGDGANDPVAYAKTLSQLTGIDPNVPLNLHDPATLAKIIPAMAQVEHGRPMAVGGDVLGAGITAGLTGRPGGSVAPGPTPSGPFVGATSAQPVVGGGGNVQPAGGIQYFPASPGGGGGGSMPGVQRGPGGAPILTPPAPWMGPLWEQSAKQYSADVDKEGGLAMRIQPFQSAISIINAHPDLKTGPTSQQWNNWGSTLSQWGVQLPSMPGDSVAAYQELSKALHQGLVNSGAFSGTDMARLEAEASSPNTQQNVEAIRELSARQIGYERFQLARLKQFRSLHPGEDPDQVANQYRRQTSQWAAGQDPVAYGADNLTPEEITAYRKGLTPQQDDKFLRSLKDANRLYPEITPGGR
jgi:hypothetical protein